MSQPHFAFRVTPFSRVLAAVLFVILPFAGFVLGMAYGGTAALPTTTVVSEAVAPEEAPSDMDGKGTEAVLIYSEQVSHVMTEIRSWPKLNIFKKVGSAAPELLATVGAVGEYPIGFVLSPDKTKLAVNLESKLLLIDIPTKTQKVLVTRDNSVLGDPAFSADSTKIAFVEFRSEYRSESNLWAATSTLSIIDLRSLVVTVEDTRVNSSEGDSSHYWYDSVIAWRPDDMFILYYNTGKDGPGNYLLYNSITKEFKPLAEPPRLVTQNGLLEEVSVDAVSVADLETCIYSSDFFQPKDNDYHIKGPSKIAIQDPLTKKQKGVIEAASSTMIQVIAYSPEEDSALYRSLALPFDVDMCNTYVRGESVEMAAQYFVKDFTDGKSTPVEDYREILASWRSDTINAYEKYSKGSSDNGPIANIFKDGAPLVTATDSQKRVAIIAQYYGQ